jgi:threonine/homoserine efflux transporter RhtA
VVAPFAVPGLAVAPFALAPNAGDAVTLTQSATPAAITSHGLRAVSLILLALVHAWLHPAGGHHRSCEIRYGVSVKPDGSGVNRS